jgi:hypothetical protein
VTKLSPVRAHNGHGDAWGVSLRCCVKKQESPVQISTRNPTELACLQELLKRLQDRHVDCAEALTKKAASDAQVAATVSPDTPSVMQAMMLFQQAKKRAQATQDPSKADKKVALESEKDKSKVSCRPTPFFFLSLRGTTVGESTSVGVRLVFWCSGVGMAVCHAISFWMFLGVCIRSSLSGRNSSLPCCRFKV